MKSKFKYVISYRLHFGEKESDNVFTVESISSRRLTSTEIWERANELRSEKCWSKVLSVHEHETIITEVPYEPTK